MAARAVIGVVGSPCRQSALYIICPSVSPSKRYRCLRDVIRLKRFESGCAWVSNARLCVGREGALGEPLRLSQLGVTLWALVSVVLVRCSSLSWFASLPRKKSRVHTECNFSACIFLNKLQRGYNNLSEFFSCLTALHAFVRYIYTAFGLKVISTCDFEESAAVG